MKDTERARVFLISREGELIPSMIKEEERRCVRWFKLKRTDPCQNQVSDLLSFAILSPTSQLTCYHQIVWETRDVTVRYYSFFFDHPSVHIWLASFLCHCFSSNSSASSCVSTENKYDSHSDRTSIPFQQTLYSFNRMRTRERSQQLEILMMNRSVLSSNHRHWSIQQGIHQMNDDPIDTNGKHNVDLLFFAALHSSSCQCRLENQIHFQQIKRWHVFISFRHFSSIVRWDRHRKTLIEFFLPISILHMIMQ